MDKQDIIDGLDVILGRRGEKINQGDILIVEAAIMALAKAKPPEEAQLDRVRVLEALLTEAVRLLKLESVVYDPDDLIQQADKVLAQAQPQIEGNS